MKKNALLFIVAVILITSCQKEISDGAQITAAIETQAAILLQSWFSTAESETQTAESNLIPTETATPEPSPTEDLLRLPEITEASCVPIETQRTLAQVVEIIDGDTIDVAIQGQVFRVRYIGMDTPEVGAPYSDEATRINRDLVGGKQVLLVKDVSEVDQYNRLLRYVFVDNQFVNYELVKRGFAQILTYPPDVACQDTFLAAQQNAIQQKAGLWKPTPTIYIPPTAIPTSAPIQPTQIPQQSNCHPSYPSVCLATDKGDYDCAGGSGNGPNYVNGPIEVLQPDPFGLDGDNDGIGCE